MAEKIFVINPGSTSTKVALFDGANELFSENIVHTQEELKKFDEVYLQADYRMELIREVMGKYGVKENELSIVMGRGGMFPPVKGGAYLVDDAMVQLICNGDIEQHASNLGGLLAKMLADESGVKAYVYDCVSVDELEPICKVTGIPEIERQSFCHALNSREMVRRYAAEIGKEYEDINCIVAHLGGGISMSAHRNGRIVDSVSDDGGAFAPERGGSVPVMYIIDMCYSGEYSYKQMKKKIRGMGGLRALLGTSNCREVEKRIAAGDENARLVYDAMIFQIAKGINLVSTVLMGKIDAIILTGGVAHSQYLTSRVAEYVKHLGPVIMMPGEHEMEALAAAGLRLLHGEKFNTL